jgi:hypothetical protein
MVEIIRKQHLQMDVSCLFDLKKSCPLSLAYQKQVHALDGFPAD